MGEYVTDLGNVQEGLSAYILEVRQEEEFADEITQTLDQNFEQMAESLGSEAAIVRSSDHEGVQQFLSRMNLSSDPTDLPILVVMQEPPEKMESGDKCIVFSLSNMDNSRDVTKVLKIISKNLNDEEFMQKLSMEGKKLYIENRVSEMVGPAGLVVSVISLL